MYTKLGFAQGNNKIVSEILHSVHLKYLQFIKATFSMSSLHIKLYGISFDIPTHKHMHCSQRVRSK